MTHPPEKLAIIGTGPIGLITALACARTLQRTRAKGPQIILCGPKPTTDQLDKDTRTTAFMQPSLSMLENLAILETCQQNAAPLKHLRMIDDCGSLLRAPDCLFSASELGLETFALNIPNKDLNRALINAISNPPKDAVPITWLETEAVTSITPHPDHVDIETREGKKFQAAFVIGADGRGSISRQAAGIAATSWQYDQTALACAFTHSAPHNATSIELHRRAGPLTLIPLQADPERGEYHASLVWSLTPQEAENKLSLDDNSFCQQLFQASHGLYGEIKSAGKRVAFPISGMKLDKLAANRIALVGEAAHVVPPIGAQGMNMGMTDVAHLMDAITEIISKSSTPFTDPGRLEDEYNQARYNDVRQRTAAIDLLNKSLLFSYLPLQAGRAAGLSLMKALPPLRKYIMQQGLGGGAKAGQSAKSASSLPSLMRRADNISPDQAA